MRRCFYLNSLVWVAGLDGWRAKVMDQLRLLSVVSILSIVRHDSLWF